MLLCVLFRNTSLLSTFVPKCHRLESDVLRSHPSSHQTRHSHHKYNQVLLITHDNYFQWHVPIILDVYPHPLTLTLQWSQLQSHYDLGEQRIMADAIRSEERRVGK